MTVLAFPSQSDWEFWLDANHATSQGLWLKIAKKASGIPTVTHAEALDVALCYGWIDGQRKSLDDVYFLQRFTPRRPRSNWSRINRDKATGFIAQGRMKPAGLREVERAKADGRWAAAYQSFSAATVPEDLQQALDANPGAKAFFVTLSGRNRYAILYRIQDAKRPDTRTRRIAEFVQMLAEGRTFY